MTHQEKVDYLVRDFANWGLKRRDVIPPAWPMLWELGIFVPPPPFLGVWLHAALLATVFYAGALCFTSAMAWFLSESPRMRLSAWEILGWPICFALPLAVFFAWESRQRFRRLALPRWSEYPKMQEPKRGDEA